MRRLLFLGLLAAALVPSAAEAVRRAPGDGTLSVRGGRGIVAIAARGGVIAQFDRGCATVKDPVEGDGTGPIVTGAERVYEISETSARYCGLNVRIKLIGGFYRLRIIAIGIDLSAVGRGSVTLGPAERLGESAGAFALNGQEYRPFPDVPTTFRLGAPVG